MSDPSRDRFIQAAIKLYPQHGYQKLSVRLLAEEAGMSAGMFHHLFDSKAEFVIAVLHRLDEQIWREWQEAESDSAYGRLLRAMQVMSFGIIGHLDVVQRVLADSANGVAAVNTFLNQRFERRARLFLRLLENCAHEDSSVPASPMQRLTYLASAVNAPAILSARYRDSGILPDKVNAALPELVSREAVNQRIGWVLSALFPQAAARHAAARQPENHPTRLERTIP